VDPNSVDEKGGPSGSPGFKLPAEAGDSRAALPRPFAFPNFRQLQPLADTRESSQLSEDRSVVAASNLIQEAEAPSVSPDSFKVPDIKGDGTPLPPNTFEPLSATGNARTDVFTLVPVANIIIGERLRGVVDGFIPIMVGSMSSYEVIQPPVVRLDPLNPGKYVLVSGLQRVNAARVRGADVILCRVTELTDVEAKLWEIDENLVRVPLSPAEEALFIDRRRELHEQLHGKSKARGALAANTAMGRNDASAKLADASFTADTAKRTGKSQRAIQRIVQRAAQNGRANLARIAGTSLDQRAELDALPMLPNATQELLIKRATAGAEVSAVRARKQMCETPAEAATPAVAAASQQQPSNFLEAESELRGLSALKSAWLGASNSARETFLAWINTTDQA
jgi:ParB-like chromosome segregation protein Spo0J